MTMSFILVGMMMLPSLAFAQQGDFTSSSGAICSFFGSTNNLLGMISVVVVTIAVVFAGYQIAFAHKRIADVAPVLIGGVLIGAAAQVAKWLIPSTTGTCTTGTTMLQHFLTHYV
jgi:type IV secretion system protein VirB2